MDTNKDSEEGKIIDDCIKNGKIVPVKMNKIYLNIKKFIL
jgi:hypothetical protein